MELEKKIVECIWRFEEEIYNGTSFVILDLNKETRIKVNILDFVTGRVLSMKCKDKKWRPVAYILKLSNKAKRNYKIHNKEILAIIRCLKV